MAYRKKTDKELAKEFVKVYHKEPTPNELRQYREYLDSFSVDAWIENQMEKDAKKYEDNIERKGPKQKELKDDSL